MKTRKIVALMVTALITNFTSPAIKGLADETSKNISSKVEATSTKASISKFDLLGNSNMSVYNEIFKMDNSNIESITNNGGKYFSSTIDKSIDGDFSTHWETGKPNNSEFTNEVIVKFKKETTLNRVIYAARQSSAKGKGFAKEVEIYASLTDNDDDFRLVGSGEYTGSTGDIVEIKFNNTKFKRIKFKFKKADQDWASTSEFMFYKEDKLRDKMETLFTDSTKSKVSEEFNSQEKINALEEEVKSHPLYRDFKEDIDNARLIVENKEVVYTDAKVSKFRGMSNEVLKEYDSIYKVPMSNLKSITTNGGQYASEAITKAMDGDINTKWHSGKQNSSSFTNEVVIELNKLTTLNRIVYTAPRGTNRGFAEQFDIYASRTTKGDTFELVSSGSSKTTQDSVEIRFNPTEFKRVKFVFKKGYENWACAAEFELYTQDKTAEKIDRLFKDNTMSVVSEEFNTIEKIKLLEDEVKKHPLENEFMTIINLAKDIINEPGKAESSVIELESRGNSIKESQKRKVWNFQDWQPTGYAAKSGEIINVYVDVEDGKPTPQLIFKQMDSQHNGQVVINLSKGKNVIKVPEVSSSELRPGTSKAGVFYTSNPYTVEEQGRKPKIRIEGAIKYPHYIKGVHTDEEVMKNLEDYVKLLEQDSNLPDVFDVFSDKTLVNVKATYALDWFKSNNKLPSETAKKSDEVIKETMRFWGFDNSSEVNSDFNFRYITMVKWLDNGGFMNAGNGITGFNKAEQGGALDVNTGWGFMHEMGHNFDTNNRTIGEVTNNILPLHFEKLKGQASKITKQNLWEKNILPKVALEDYSNNEYYPENDKSLLSHIAPLWQLQLYDETFWPRFEQEFRSRNIGGGSWENKHNAWVMVASDVFKLDLAEHFERHGMNVLDETKTYTAKYSKPSKKLWYANDKMYLNKGGVFTDDVKYEASAKISNNNEVVLNFSIDKVNKNNIIGYEVFRDGKAIGFTSINSFTDKTAVIGENHKYTVVAYDNELNAAEPYNFNLYAPTLSVEELVVLRLNEKFNPLDYVKAYKYEGTDISNKIKVLKNNVDTSKKGLYEIVYQITDEGDTREENLKVEVVSDYDYLSDFEWESAETQWGTPRKNTNIKGKVNGAIKDFDKGLGIHANGKIVYSLEGKEYDRFIAQVGVDAGIQAQNNSSIKFNIIADGEILTTTSVLKYADGLVQIDVPVSGVKELVIEVDNAENGNTSDHGVIANPKLITSNAKPRIITSDKVYKIGEAIDFNEGIGAIDAEDGDLTPNIQIISNSYEEGKLGRFEVVYKVTDSDNNSVEKKSYITVYEDLNVIKSKYGQFDKLNEYNEQFKIPVVSVTNNGGNYPHTKLEYTIDNNRNTHWETGKQNTTSFKNEVIFDLGEITEISKMAFAARNGGKGFAKKFEIYTSIEAKGDDFILAGIGEYSGSVNDVVEFNIAKTSAKRVKFKFIEANQDWASIGEMSFYKEDVLANKISKELFTDNTKTEVSERYNTLEKVQVLREEVKEHPAASLFEEDLKMAEKIIMTKFPTLNIPKSVSVKVGEEIDLNGQYSATDNEDGDITSKVEVSGKVNFNKTGKYTVTYKVTDSDGNEVVKTRTISVVDMNDHKYLTDYDWKSANSGWKTVNKDKSVSDNKLALTDENREVIYYDRGIGTHATSTIIYDLTDKDYAYFSSYVGVDRQMFGSVGSIKFEVYVDGEKKFDSGVMNSRESQKYVEVDISDAKELKLVVTDGGNGIGSDHATWGDTKLYFVNDIQGNYEELEALVEKAKGYKEDVYTEETFNIFKEALNKAITMLEDKISSQDDINSMVTELNQAISNLEESIDLNQVISIKDEYLKDSIKKELNLSSDDITIGDMHKLIKLSSPDKWISSLEGLEYAKNLESLDVSYNEIKDLSPLKNLKKLESLNANPQIITEGMLYAKDNKITLDYKVLNRNAEKLKVKDIIITKNVGNESVDLSLDELIDENGVISFDISNLNKGFYSIYLIYEDEKDNFLTQSLYMFDVR
ncbi:NPCBM/NEW2 domain-containing protein [Clostridium mediterraneense]|uniref:NPCBM/NEW2 domain-containing protein n=1 Tax=Clostridium mediterraneense TaxID=1805472 RepID=UPI00083129DC|nr:NPCBM/NEW2 domain-containing protein [Clostridium mediterraneense]